MNDHDRDPTPEEPADEISRTTNEAKAKLDDIERDFQTRLDQLSEKSDVATSKYRAQQAKTERERRSDQEAHRGLGYGLTYAYILAGPPIAGYFVGLIIDQNQTGTDWKSWLAIAGVVFGFVAMLVLINRDNNRSKP